MKKIVSFLLVLTFMLALSACGNTQDVNGSCRVVIMGETATEYSVDLSEVEVTEGDTGTKTTVLTSWFSEVYEPVFAASGS